MKRSLISFISSVYAVYWCERSESRPPVMIRMIWSSRRQHQIPDEPLRVGSDLVQPVRSVHNLGIHLDSHLSMNTHVTRTVSCCFAVLRQIRSISRSVSQPVVQSLIVSLVISRLDYGSATLAGLPACQLDRLQSVLNAAARLILQIQ